MSSTRVEVPPILPLPSTVILRLRSTVTLPTLSVAISELVQNALDAAATQLSLSLNPSKPSFTLTDNGHGIHPDHIASIGTLYTTSKYPPDDRHFGSRGEALAALAQHSILTITSRARGWRWSRQVRWSYGKKVFCGDAPEYAALEEPGTTVRVEGLWGDMPVRLKARERTDIDREWAEVLKTVSALLMSGRGKGVGVVVRDELGTRRMIVNRETGPCREPWDHVVLRQAFGNDVIGDIGTWETVKARQNGVRIEGWISSKGNGSKVVQFISVNGFPLASGDTELHREVNRIFASSGFGVVEDLDGKGMPKRGGTRKGVDRYGMYVLRIECHEGRTILGGEGGTDGKAGVEGQNLKSVIQLLQRLVYEFLKAHHCKPSHAENTSGKVGTNASDSGRTIPELFLKQCTEKGSRSGTPSSTRGESAFSKPRARLMDIETWSRVKAAKADPKEIDGRCTISGPTKLSAAPPSSVSSSEDLFGSPSERANEVVNWTNPSSGRSYQVDTRTGNTTLRIAPSLTGTKRTSSATLTDRRISIPQKRSRSTTSSSSTASQEPGEFVQNLLAKWKNPVFPPTEAEIPSMPLEPSPTPHDCHRIQEPFTTATSQRLGKLTKAGLQNAEVIAQVYNKYILLKMRGASSCPDSQGPEMLVIVDQHAADERIRVERLFRELCQGLPDEGPPDPTQSVKKALTFSINSRDSQLLRRFRSEFLRWGIGYEVTGATVEVHSLPRVARDRCDNEPVLAVELLRKHAYALEERGIRPPALIEEDGEETSGDDWVRQLSHLPEPLKEMVNSRACRGAIMFNDPLTLEECRVLIQRLATCRWPFMCAHGRVSMRPLVELGSVAADAGVRARERRGGFKDAFVRWKKAGDG
ncbi:hypothetical protein FN846DRAFT_1004513 [Sphaerosporella brunnea]|uniref:MutL C-terminal dimerisation domain-containing protein n=1 Tax=Sphaerosporella brunnea TaxID=1250544 RepID=A0A5J5F3M2_9PEZI|nr:hypothetical protein FN846DRAFT_1004513 [Sphaerosporella brunnea]